MRIGHGYDAHRLVEGEALVLGGVHIPYEKGLSGHSDADVLLHAVMDAILGAAALGDIGMMYPPSDERYKGVSSRILLAGVIERIRELGFSVSSLDCTVIAEKPKLSPYFDEMRVVMSELLGLSGKRIGVKATTEEGLGFTGAGLGIAAHAVVLLDE